jgi:hypothetical protein
MTQANPSAQHLPDLDDDDLLPEYDFSGGGVRGKYAKVIREKGYSVTVHHADGTATHRYVSPSEILEQDRQRAQFKPNTTHPAMTHEPNYTWTGDRIAGDKIGGDKVMGNKVQIGTVQGDGVAGNKTVNSQNLTQAAQDIKDLLNQLAIDHPNDDEFTQAGRAIGAIKANPTLKQRLINAAKESGTTAVEKAIEAVVNTPAVSIVIAGVKGFIKAES